MKKKLVYISICCMSLSLSSSIIVADTSQTIIGENQASMDLVGTFGSDNPAVDYTINAHNFIVHVKDFSHMDILTLSGATVSTTKEKSDSVVLQLLSTNVKAKPGVYKAELGIKNSSNTKKSITIFVIDDSTFQDGRTVFYAHDFVKLISEKKNLTAEEVKILAEAHAFDVVSGSEITPQVVVEQNKLDAYISETTSVAMPIDFIVSSGTGILTATVHARTIIDNSGKGGGDKEGSDTDSNGASSSKKSPAKNLPKTGTVKDGIVNWGMMLLAFLGIYLWKRNKEPNDYEEIN